MIARRSPSRAAKAAVLRQEVSALAHRPDEVVGAGRIALAAPDSTSCHASYRAGLIRSFMAASTTAKLRSAPSLQVLDSREQHAGVARQQPARLEYRMLVPGIRESGRRPPGHILRDREAPRCRIGCPGRRRRRRARARSPPLPAVHQLGDLAAALRRSARCSVSCEPIWQSMPTITHILAGSPHGRYSASASA